jgi:hypothetical protein
VTIDRVLSWRRPIWRLFGAFALGCAAALSGFVFGMPGHGAFVPAMWLAGFAALLMAPGWPGFVALIAGAALAATLLDLADGVFGLVWLIVAIVVALAGHGALAASVVVRLRALGWRLGMMDASVLRGGGLALGLVLIFVWMAGDFARNPP